MPVDDIEIHTEEGESFVVLFDAVVLIALVATVCNLWGEQRLMFF